MRNLLNFSYACIFWWNFNFFKISSYQSYWIVWLLSVSFFFIGADLYSGGEECSLVCWALNKNTKRIIPRLGMPISYVRAQGEYAICLHKDNGNWNMLFEIPSLISLYWVSNWDVVDLSGNEYLFFNFFVYCFHYINFCEDE